MKKKTIALILAIALVAGVAAGTTIAWLTDKTDDVVNTFTVGNIDIDLKESEGLDLKMVPGKTLTKDPFATVEKGSEKCYLFVKAVKSEDPDFDDFMTYDVADGWTELTTGSGIYYRVVEADDAEDQSFPIIANDEVEVKDTVTKTMMDALTEAGKNPTLTFTAYACQYAGFEDNAEGAWNAANPSN